MRPGRSGRAQSKRYAALGNGARRVVLGADVLGRMRNKPWPGARLGVDARIQRAVYLSTLQANVAIGRQLAEEAVFEAEELQGVAGWWAE